MRSFDLQGDPVPKEPTARGKAGAPVSSTHIMGRTIIERRPVHVPDLRADPTLAGSGTASSFGARTCLGVPLLREGEAFGAFVVARRTVRPFSDREVALVRTFADQAGIAMENVRLLEDVRDKSRALEAASRHKSEFLANMS